MKQYKVSLPDDLHARLEAARKKSGRSLSDEIRTRIEQSLEKDVDKPTRDFLTGVALMPAEIELETGAAWHKHPAAFAVFREAILRRLARLKPEGGTLRSYAFGKRPHQAMPGPADPEELGVWIESQLHKFPDYTNSEYRRALEESYRELLKLHQQGKKGETS
jgi:hypothetical protein